MDEPGQLTRITTTSGRPLTYGNAYLDHRRAVDERGAIVPRHVAAQYESCDAALGREVVSPEIAAA